MNAVLTDTSVWIDYFRGSNTINYTVFDKLIDNNQICINDLILSELVPFLYVKKHTDVIKILESLRNIPLDIDWQDIIRLQTKNITNGINKVGIPDLIILQNAIQNDITLYSLDRHFELMNKIFKFSLMK